MPHILPIRQSQQIDRLRNIAGTVIHPRQNVAVNVYQPEGRQDTAPAVHGVPSFRVTGFGNSVRNSRIARRVASSAVEEASSS